MQTTTLRCAASSRGRRQIQSSWMSPGLTSHQQLDAGIAARQHAGRKALKKSKKPFENYFRTQFRFSPRVGVPVLQSSGIMSSYNAVRMRTDPTKNWAAPWDPVGTNTQRKRKDVIELTPTTFGEDDTDKLLSRLMELRFLWDREDGVLCTSLMPDSLFSATTHCRPYQSEVGPSPSLAQITDSPSLSMVTTLANTDDDSSVEGANTEEADGEEVVMIAGTPVRIRRRSAVALRVPCSKGQPKRPHQHSSRGFSGVDTVPSLMLDVSHGPFVTATSSPLMTLRWKGEHRDAASAQEALQMLRQLRAVPVVGLTARSTLLLLKGLATVEVEEPALAVSLAIAIGEHYHAYSDTECLEVLRCLQRLALVRALPDLAPPDINTTSVAASAGLLAPPVLYVEATLTEGVLAGFLQDAAPFLVAKIWSRLPEQSRHFLERGYFVDWLDLLRLAVAAHDSQRLPERLPNSASEAPYAAKYLFLRHTLGLTGVAVRTMVTQLRCSDAAPASGHNTTTKSEAHLVDAVREEVDKPLLLWHGMSVLVRVVAEALGDVVRHVADSLHGHAALAAERLETRVSASEEAAVAKEEEETRAELADAGPRGKSHALYQPYPRFRTAAYQQMGCRRPRRVRVRLLPFEAFPRVAQCFSVPCAAITERVEAQERKRHKPKKSKHAPAPQQPSIATDCVAVLAPSSFSMDHTKGRMQSSFAAVLAESPLLRQHLIRACAALRWSTEVLRGCHALVDALPAVPASPLFVSARTAVPSTGGISAGKRQQQHRSSGRDTWARETAAMEVRHALCHRYIRSHVQRNMDAIFTYIPWGELERQWEPMLTAGEGEEEDAPLSLDAEDAVDEATVDDVEPFNLLTAEALDRLLMEEADTTTSTGCSPPTAAPLSEEEQEARAAMEELRECLEDFQLVVADLLEAHEGFFGTPASSPPLTADAKSA